MAPKTTEPLYAYFATFYCGDRDDQLVVDAVPIRWKNDTNVLLDRLPRNGASQNMGLRIESVDWTPEAAVRRLERVTERERDNAIARHKRCEAYLQKIREACVLKKFVGINGKPL